ncbi:MAG: DUF721 domain-containing protein [Bacteroidia bacterium]|nr:DUF721 domain-containing protein [Bacteroidia bacterium]MDW8133763.1 DUF721 domain-containing protein [Bacteroidia bacterium]
MSAPKSIGELIQAFIVGKMNEKNPLPESYLRDMWERVVGREIATITRRITYRRGNLTIYLDDPLIRKELSYHTAHLTELLREYGLNGLKRLEIK